MQNRKYSLALAGMLCLGLLVAPVFAQEEGKPEGTPGVPDPKEMMDDYAKLAEPGEHHQHLNYFVGKWNMSVKSFMSGPEPTVSPGTSTYKWILGNRYMVSDVESSMMGMPFMGHSMTCYDKGLKKYTDVWCDSMSTGFMISYGTCDASGKNWTYEGEYVDPMTGEKAKTKQELKVVDDNSFVFTMYGAGPDGTEMKMMEITYSRS